MKINKFLSLLLMVIMVPLSFLWDTVYRIRRFCYNYHIFNSNKFYVPIISVGNLTFGGSGKTPFIIWLSKYLNSKKKRVMVLTRGYKGKLESTGGILRSNRKLGHNPLDFGDEALMISKRLNNTSVVVGKKRSENLMKYFYDELPDIVLMDDGYQHLKIERSLNIVMFDSLLPISKYKVAPWGYLREGPSALKDADIILFARSDQASHDNLQALKQLIKKYVLPDTPMSEIGYRPTSICDCNLQEVMPLEDLKGKRIVCVAGLASPISFFKLISTLGGEIVDKYVFPDHHIYRKSDLELICKRAELLNAIIITSEKDMVKIQRLSMAENFYYLEISIYFMNGEEMVCDLIDKTMITD